MTVKRNWHGEATEINGQTVRRSLFSHRMKSVGAYKIVRNIFGEISHIGGLRVERNLITRRATKIGGYEIERQWWGLGGPNPSDTLALAVSEDDKERGRSGSLESSDASAFVKRWRSGE